MVHLRMENGALEKGKNPIRGLKRGWGGGGRRKRNERYVHLHVGIYWCWISHGIISTFGLMLQIGGYPKLHGCTGIKKV